MPVSVNPIKNDAAGRNVEILQTALGLARDAYKVSLDQDQFNKVQELTQKKADDALSADEKKLAWQAQENEKDRASKAALEQSKIAAEKELKSKELALKMPGGALALPKQTQGQKALDTSFARDFNDWEMTGKSAVAKNLALLEGVKNKLIKRQNDLIGTSGRFTGNLPDFLRSEESIALREDVHRAAQSSLRATLGSSYTEKEGERIMNASYNEKLSPAENIKRINATIAELEQNAMNTEARARYFEDNGTLVGYRGQSSSNVADKEREDPAKKVVKLNDGQYTTQADIDAELARRMKGTASK